MPTFDVHFVRRSDRVRSRVKRLLDLQIYPHGINYLGRSFTYDGQRRLVWNIFFKLFINTWFRLARRNATGR